MPAYNDQDYKILIPFTIWLFKPGLRLLKKTVSQ